MLFSDNSPDGASCVGLLLAVVKRKQESGISYLIDGSCCVIIQTDRLYRKGGIGRILLRAASRSLFGAPGERTFYRVKVPNAPGSGKR